MRVVAVALAYASLDESGGSLIGEKSVALLIILCREVSKPIAGDKHAARVHATVCSCFQMGGSTRAKFRLFRRRLAFPFRC